VKQLPPHYYRCILADPPWSFKTYAPDGGNRSARKHYNTMSLGQLADLKVRAIADLSCWMFLWAVTPMLPAALSLMTSWGFDYSGTAFVWAKTTRTGSRWHIGLGYTTRKNVELCLLGKCGSPSVNSHSVRELMIAPIREHSRKPDEQYERIERFCDGPRIELFSRSVRPRWDAWGDQVEKFREVVK